MLHIDLIEQSAVSSFVTYAVNRIHAIATTFDHTYMDKLLTVMAKLNDSIREKAREVVDEALEENRENWRAWIEEHTDKVVLNQRAERGGFHLRLQARRDEPLRYLELLYRLALDGGATAHERYSPQADEEDDLVFQVLVRLHAQACSIGSEIISLLRTGHAAGVRSRHIFVGHQ